MHQASPKVQAIPPIPAAATPRAATGTAPTTTTVAIPQTTAEANSLRSRVSELKGQLDAATSRRDGLHRQLPNAYNGPDRAGIEGRLTQLDSRIFQIETDIADADRALSAAPAGVYQTTSQTGRVYNGPNPAQATAISIVGTIFVLFPLSIAFARLLWRRAVHPLKPVPPSPELTSRLERMEQGIEVIALEVERISEGQRFVTRLMSANAERAHSDPARLPADARHAT